MMEQQLLSVLFSVARNFLFLLRTSAALDAYYDLLLLLQSSWSPVVIQAFNADMPSDVMASPGSLP